MRGIRSNEGEPGFAFRGLQRTRDILPATVGGFGHAVPGTRQRVPHSVVGAEGLEPPTYAL